MSRRPILPRINREANDGQYNSLGLPGGLWGFHTRVSTLFAGTDANHVPKFDHTQSNSPLPPMTEEARQRVVTLDPHGYDVLTNFQPYLEQGYKLLPTGAVNKKLTFTNPYIVECVRDPYDDLMPDGVILKPNGDFAVTQITMDQVWHLKGFAGRVGMTEQELRSEIFRALGEEMFPQLVEDDRIEALLPPIGGISVRVFGDMAKLQGADTPVAVRLHDFCHDGDAGACLCSCCVYRNFAIKKCIQMAQQGGVGITIEGLDEGTGYGSVIKHTVYNGRMNPPQGDHPDNYYSVRRALTGGDDGRMPWTKLAVLHVLGVKKIDQWISMSSDKRRDVEEKEGIVIGDQVELPKKLRRASFDVELDAKINNGYFNGNGAGHSGNGNTPKELGKDSAAS